MSHIPSRVYAPQRQSLTLLHVVSLPSFMHCYRRQLPARILMKTTLNKAFPSSESSFEKYLKSKDFTLKFTLEKWHMISLRVLIDKGKDELQEKS